MSANFYPYLKWILIFPLFGFTINFLFGKKLSEKQSGILASLMILLSFIVSTIAFNDLLKLQGLEKVLKENLYTWFAFGGLNISITFRFDNLSSVMALMVTGVSFLIHIYSMGYMHKDKDFTRFFSYLNLFVFFMLLLVLADNPVLMFVGWEGVGLCSYLLIGFWYEDLNNAKAGKKAFITNRVGDAAFLIGMMLLIMYFNLNQITDLSFDSIEKNYTLLLSNNILGLPLISVISILLFIGATGKSAQFPLYVWLPDAMAGPTPVSALIHAATMVTAGVYMVSRLFYIFSNAPYALEVILYVSAFTAFFSAIIALLQKDIKKILAYSTISQIGYMFMGLGAGVYAAGFFHLITHAFFKALLFLGAGSVIHAMGGEQDIFKMGNLKNKIKSTFSVMLIAYLTISGIPPLSGFYSKDNIIEQIYFSGHKEIWLLAIITAGLTAFYMTRLFKITFLGKDRSNNVHPHESPNLMLYPMYILALLAIIAGFFTKDFLHFVGPELKEEHLSFFVKESPLIFALLGIILGFYLTKDEIAEKLKNLFKPLHTLILNKFYIDEIYELIIIKPLNIFSNSFLFSVIDRKTIDDIFVNGIPKSIYYSGNVIRKIQNGNIQLYLLFFFTGLIIFLTYIMVVK